MKKLILMGLVLCLFALSRAVNVSEQLSDEQISNTPAVLKTLWSLIGN